MTLFHKHDDLIDKNRPHWMAVIDELIDTIIFDKKMKEKDSPSNESNRPPTE